MAPSWPILLTLASPPPPPLEHTPQADSIIANLDLNHDHKVSRPEFMQAMEFLCQGLEEEEFLAYLADIYQPGAWGGLPGASSRVGGVRWV